jgi:hypothetical protein
MSLSARGVCDAETARNRKVSGGADSLSDLATSPTVSQSAENPRLSGPGRRGIFTRTVLLPEPVKLREVKPGSRTESLPLAP